MEEYRTERETCIYSGGDYCLPPSVSLLIIPHFPYTEIMAAQQAPRRQDHILANSTLCFRRSMFAVPLALLGTVPTSRLVTDVLMTLGDKCLWKSLGLIITCRALNFPCHTREEAELGWAAVFWGVNRGNPFFLTTFWPPFLFPLLSPPPSGTAPINVGPFLQGQVLGLRNGRIYPP